MIIHNFNLLRISIVPDETNPPLIIDPDAVLTGAGSFERFQAIAGWCQQIP